MKIGRWSEMLSKQQTTSRAITLFGSFVKILSIISVAVFEVFLVGREINGKNDLENIV